MADARPSPLWGVTAEFETAEGMVEALRLLRGRRLGRLDGFSPVPIPEAFEALDLPRQPVHPFALAGALGGGLVMFGLCTYATIWSYRLDVGGRPLFSWPAFLVPSVSFAMLVGALAAFLVLLVLNRLPRLNHPAFDIPDFGRASADRFFVAVEAQDERFDPGHVEQLLAGLPRRPARIARVSR